MIFRPRRKSFYGKPKPRQTRSPWIILSIPLILILLEIVLRLVGAKSDQYQQKLNQINAYTLKFVTKDQKTIEGLNTQGNLIAQRDISLGYKLVGSQSNDYLKLNEQGFRDDQPLTLAKPKDEIRIFILGNSTAFGQGIANNEATIAHKLELRLQQRVNIQQKSPEKYRPDIFPFFKPLREKAFSLPGKIKEGKYRVINAAVPGYSSGNTLAQVALEILPYNPDLIIILDGYEDLLLPSNDSETDIPQIESFLADARGHFFTYLKNSLSQNLDEFYLVKLLKYRSLKPNISVEASTLAIRENSHSSLGNLLPSSEEELNLRVDRYRNNHKQLINLCAKARIPVLIAVQPEITGRKNLSSQEQQIAEQLDKNYREKVAQSYPKIVEAGKQLERAFPKNIKFLNFYNLNNKFPANTFADAIHLTEEGNQEMAEQLYSALTNLETMQIIPENFYLKDD